MDGKQEISLPELRSKKSSQSHSKDDYENLGSVGRGAYGHVYLVKRKDHYYAMKEIQKKKLGK